MVSTGINASQTDRTRHHRAVLDSYEWIHGRKHVNGHIGPLLRTFKGEDEYHFLRTTPHDMRQAAQQ